jgi:hypothetical protein
MRKTFDLFHRIIHRFPRIHHRILRFVVNQNHFELLVILVFIFILSFDEIHLMDPSFVYKFEINLISNYD